jgi:hypothetical protein
MSQLFDRENGIEWNQAENGDWIWKAIKATPLSAKKTTKEKPFFKISLDIEKKYHQRYDRALIDGVKDIARYLHGTG